VKARSVYSDARPDATCNNQVVQARKDGQTLLFAQNSALTRRRWRPWVAISWRHDTTVALLSIR
jgi:hypothetical protein